MMSCYLAFWSPECVDESGEATIIGKPKVEDAAKYVEHSWRGVVTKIGCCKKTLYNARKWAVDHGLPCRPIRTRRFSLKLSPKEAYELCLQCFGPDAELETSVELLALQADK